MTDAGGSPGPSRWDWQYLTADEAAALWVELAEWVAWLRARFNLPAKRLPPCWFMHPPIVEVLTALMAGWKATYRVDDPDAWGWYRTEPLVFMQHEFWPALDRVAALAGCKPGQCEFVQVEVVTHHALAEVIAADVDARR